MAEGETIDISGTQGSTQVQPQWYQPAESLRTTDPDVWTSFEKGVTSGGHKDLPTLIKNHVNLEKRLGTALVPPGKDAKPEDVAAFREKLYATGHIAKPPVLPDSPEKYELKLDSIPENLRMPELIGEFQGWAHKNGIPPEAANELLELNAKQFSAANQLYEGSRQEAETRIAALAQKDGRDMNSVMESGKRAANHLLKDSPKTLEKLNTFLGNDPDIMYALSKMGEALGEDTHEIPPDSGGGGAGEEAKAEMNEAKAIKFDPAHPQHSAYLSEGINGPLHAKVDAAYKKAFGTKVEV